MQGTKGIHAFATFISVIVVLWVTWGFINSILSTPTDTIQSYLYWGSFIIIGLITMIAVPYLIAMRDDSTASIISAFSALGTWAVMLLINMLLFPFFNAIVNIFTDLNAGIGGHALVTTLQDGGLIIKIFSIFFLLIVIGTLYILPLLMAINPTVITDRIRGMIG